MFTKYGPGNSVVVRTHGGLGNQIFQIFFARLLARGQHISIVHDANYEHAFQLCSVFSGYPRPGFAAGICSAMRIPKVLERTNISSRGVIKLGRTTFVDGYFQSVRFYEQFDAISLNREVERLRSELQIDPKEMLEAELHHIRLGDFFPDLSSQRGYLIKRMEEIPTNSFIISNREDLINEWIDANPQKNIITIPSVTASANELLKLMSQYKTIVSNDSTLAFWAACLAGRNLVTPSKALRALLQKFRSTSRTIIPKAYV